MTGNRYRPLPFLTLCLAATIAVAGCAGRRAPQTHQVALPPPTPIAVKRADIETELLPPTGARDLAQNPYLIGPEDELHISVYGHEDLVVRQAVRPDGKVAFPLIGDVTASGRSPAELGADMSGRLRAYVENPRVTVVVTAYRSQKVRILGEVRAPGVVPLSADMDLLEGLSRVGGVTEQADLRGSMLIRGGEVLPVNFEKLLRRGDLRHNARLEASDVVLVPNVDAKKIFVLGEVQRPIVTRLKHDVTLAESIALAGGFTDDAEKSNIVVVRGGLNDPVLYAIDFESITEDGRIDYNIALQAGDIVYVPRSMIGEVDLFFQRVARILQPIIMAETGIVLGPDVYSVLTTGETRGDDSIIVVP